MSTFLTPWMLTLFALLAPLIILMYILKLKRRPQFLPSTLLWRRSVEDLVANSPFQRLKNNLLLWLQLLILLLLVLALARPVMQLAGMDGQRVVVLIDLTASMQTVEENGQTRLNQAKDLAVEAVDQMRVPNPLFGGFTARDEMMVLGFTDKTIPIQPLTSDRNALRSAINRLDAMDTEADLTDMGLILEEKIMRRVDDRMETDPNARVVLISDGQLGETIDSLVEIENLEYIRVGQTNNNLGFVSSEVRESFSGQFDYQLFAEIINSTDEEREVFVELELDGSVIDLKRVVVPAGEIAPVVFIISEGITGLATMTLVDHEDAFSGDDVAYVNVLPPSTVDILLVSPGNIFLERAFGADARTSISVVSPSNFEQQDQYDITIFDRCSQDIIPDELMIGNYLFVDCLPPQSLGFSMTGDPVEMPRVIDWSRVHPITRLADFETLRLQEALSYTYPEADTTPLVQAIETDLIVYYETEPVRAVVVAFDITESYWPVDTSYMFFVLNLLDYWSRSGRGAEQAAYASGSMIPIFPPRNSKEATVTLPDGDRIDYEFENDQALYLTDTSQTGIYTASFGEEGSQRIPVNLSSRLESNIKPVETLVFGPREVASTENAIRTRQELWPWLLLLGLGVLMAEWYIYCRRTFL